MPMRVHSSQTTDRPARAERMLLRELGMPLSIGARDASDHGAADPCAALFLSGMRHRGFAFVERLEVPRVEARLSGLSELGTVELSWGWERAHDALLTLPGGELVLLTSHGGTCEVVVAARTAAAACGALRSIADRVCSAPPADERVRVQFWAAGGCGAEVQRRLVDAPSWEEICANYTERARRATAALVAAVQPGHGSLLLWHGPPGTGKTHALRALIGAWRPWCAPHYVTDPERFLAGTSYLMEVATARGGDGETPPWRLIVLEDAGELMAASARSETGQGLSRVLNLTDGLLGQGVRCLLLVTTNEPLGRLHPALQRPGRCWASIEFGPLSAAEASAWLALPGVQREVSAPMTLAELYATADGREPPVERRDAFGFARAIGA